MAIIRNTYTDALFNGLMAAGCTIYGACGAMGNIYAESGANPRNLENLCEKRLNYKYTDDTYTEAVDSGEITRDLFCIRWEIPDNTVMVFASGRPPEEKQGCMTW